MPVFSFSARGQRCDKCHNKVTKTKIDLNKCPGCSYAHYCSEACYETDLVNHVYSGECDIFKKRTPPNENVRFLLRFFLKLRVKDESDLKK